MNDIGKNNATTFDDDSSFDSIQANFQKVISALVNDNSLDAFRIEYEKLFTSLENSHACNQQLIERIRELNAEINVNSSKVQSALRYSQEDQKTINILRRDFEKAWQTVEALHARENRSKEIISALKAELVHLSELAEKQGSYDTTATIKELQENVDQLQTEVKSNNQIVKSLQTQLDKSKNDKKVLVMKIESLSNIREELEHELSETNIEIKNCDNEGNSLTNSVLNMTNENNDFQENFEKRTTTISEKQKLIENYQNKLKKDQQSITEFGLTIRYHQNKANEYHKKLETKKKSIEMLEQQKDELSVVVEDKAKMLEELKTDLTRLNNQRVKIDQLYSEFTQVHKEKTKQINQLKQQLNQYRKQKLNMTRAFDVQDSKIKFSQREVSKKQQDVIKEEANCKKEKDEISICKAQSDNLQKDIINSKKEKGTHRQTISEIQDEIAMTENETSTTKNNIIHLEMETQQRKDESLYLKKQIKELNRQKQSIELSMNEINEHHAVDARRYVQLFNENQAIEKDLHFLKLNVTEFKETITKSDNQCMEILANRRICEEQSRKLSDDIQKVKSNIENASQTISKSENEITANRFILSQSKSACTEINNNMKNMRDQLTNIEREISKRTKELEILREKTQIITSTFSKSNLKYNETTEEIDRLATDLKRELDKQQILISKRKRVDQLTKEYSRIEKELIIAQSQSTMLEEESTKPISIHRWTLLESTNPEQFERIQLRTALLDKINNLLNQERSLKFKKEAYSNRISMKTAMVKKQPVYDSSEVEAYKKLDRLYKEKTERLNSLSQKTQKVKEEADEWRDRVSYKESLIIEQKEQFYITKQRETAISLSASEEAARIREPKISFNRGQAPRSIVPRLKIVEPKTVENGKKTLNARKSPRNIVGRKRSAMPLLPPLVPKTVR